MTTIESPQPSPQKMSPEALIKNISEEEQQEIHALRETWISLYDSFISEIQETPAKGHAISLATDIRQKTEELYKSIVAHLSTAIPANQVESLGLLLLTSEIPSQDLDLPRKEQVFEMLKAAEAVFSDVKEEVGQLYPPFFTPLIERIEPPQRTAKKESRATQERRKKLTELQRELEERELIESLTELEQWPPKHSFKPENGPRVFFPDKPFSIESSDTPRRSMVVYVDAGDLIKPRVIYGSSTHAVLKALPRVGVRGKDVVWFDKADAQESISLGIPYQIKLMPTMYRTDSPIQQLGSEEKHQWLRDIVRSVDMGKQYDEKYRQATFFMAVKPSISPLIPTNTFPNDPRLREQLEKDSIPPQMYYPESLHLPDAFPHHCPTPRNPKNMKAFIETNADAYLPTHFNGAISATLPRYGKSRVWDFESTEGTRLRYLVMETFLESQNKERAVWVGAAERVKNSRKEQLSYNTYLVPEEYDHLNPITTPPIEHYGDVRHLMGDYRQTAWDKKFNCTIHGNSVNMWPFIKHLPVIEAFLAKTENIDRERYPQKYSNR